MPTETVRFGSPALKRALAEADGRHASNAALILRDPAEVGLTIRVSGKSVGWYLRWDGTFKRLAGVGNPDVTSKKREKGLLYTCTDASELADHVRELMKAGMDVDGYLKVRMQGKSHDEAAATGASIAARGSGAWTFAVLAERYLAEKVSMPSIRRNGSVKPEKPQAIRDTRAIMRHPDVVAALDKELVRDLRKRDIETIRDAWWREGAKSRQRKLVTYIKSAMTWAKERHSGAGLDDVLPWWVELHYEAYASQAEMDAMEGKPGGRPLTAQEVALLLDIAEEHRVAPGRKIALETSEIAMAALWWVALTAQRTHAAYQATISRVDDRVTTDGWYDVSWVPRDVKSGRHFSLAIPPDVYDRTLGRALRDPHRRPDSVWIFASSRTKVKGKDEHADRPVGDTILNSLLGRLRGVKDGKKVGDDLLAAAGLPHFTLHELRDALATHLASHTSLPASAASAILDHANDGDRDPDAKESTVTRDHYNKSQRLSLKFAGLSAWSEAVLTEYETLRAKRHARMRSPLNRATAPKRMDSRRAAERAAAALASKAAAVDRSDASIDLKRLGAMSGEEGFDERGAAQAAALRDEEG